MGQLPGSLLIVLYQNEIHNLKPLIMTTYSHTITLSDSEMIMLIAALDNMIEHCQAQLDLGKGAPYWAHKQSAESVKSKLFRHSIQASGNNFYELDFGTDPTEEPQK